MIDVTHEINSVERQIGGRTLDAGQARTMVVSRVYDTTPEDLWDACTNPERLPRWFLPVSGDLREGGRYDLEGNASGTIARCAAPNALDATWEYGGQTSWIELRLTPEGDGRTRFALEHIAQVGDDLWAQFGPGAVGIGWDQAIMSLTMHITGTAEGAEVQAWQATEEGIEFVRESSDAWAEASIAAGTDADEARAAAGRTTDFYTPSTAS